MSPVVAGEETVADLLKVCQEILVATAMINRPIRKPQPPKGVVGDVVAGEAEYAFRFCRRGKSSKWLTVSMAMPERQK